MDRESMTANPILPTDRSSGVRLPLDDLPTAPDHRGFSLLEGIRGLDVTNSIAVPYRTGLLAVLGAAITKVAPAGWGEDTRAWGPPFLDGEALWFLAVNRNKRSIELDLSAEARRDVLVRLA